MIYSHNYLENNYTKSVSSMFLFLFLKHLLFQQKVNHEIFKIQFQKFKLTYEVVKKFVNQVKYLYIHKNAQFNLTVTYNIIRA